MTGALARIAGANGRAIRVALVAVCLLMALWLGQSARDQRRVANAVELANSGDLAGAVALARRVDGRPAALRARLLEGRALTAAGRPDEAVAAFRRAATYAPSDASLHLDWAVAELARGRRRAARAQMQRALELDPKLRLPPGFVLVGVQRRRPVRRRKGDVSFRGSPLYGVPFRRR